MTEWILQSKYMASVFQPGSNHCRGTYQPKRRREHKQFRLELTCLNNFCLLPLVCWRSCCNYRNGKWHWCWETGVWGLWAFLHKRFEFYWTAMEWLWNFYIWPGGKRNNILAPGCLEHCRCCQKAGDKTIWHQDWCSMSLFQIQLVISIRFGSS